MEVPIFLLPFVNQKQFKTQQTAYYSFILIANGDILSGKVAELLDISKIELLDMSGEMDIPYYNQTCEELESDVRLLFHILLLLLNVSAFIYC